MKYGADPIQRYPAKVKTFMEKPVFLKKFIENLKFFLQRNF